jgi:hypothetical protein
MNTMKLVVVSCLLAISAAALAQDSIPPGTILPIRLNSTLSFRTQPGQGITGRVMQDVPLADGRKIKEGAKVIGHVIAVSQPANVAGSHISFTFDKLVVSKRTILITTSLRAIASFVEVESAQIPEGGPDRGTPQDAWTTDQVGGDTVYRGGGPVKEGSKTVGMPVYDGVLSHLVPSPGCSGQLDDNSRPQALWVFSANACGAYGFPDLTIDHSGQSKPTGEISLSANGYKLNIHSGSGLLLRVMDTGKSTT